MFGTLYANDNYSNYVFTRTKHDVVGVRHGLIKDRRTTVNN